jgi:hypothetical protein
VAEAHCDNDILINRWRGGRKVKVSNDDEDKTKSHRPERDAKIVWKGSSQHLIEYSIPSRNNSLEQNPNTVRMIIYSSRDKTKQNKHSDWRLL